MAFDSARFRALAGERELVLGSPLVVMAETGSTNDDAMNAARGGAAHGATFVAEAQTAGRGRRGAAWTSTPGENLTFSVLLRVDLPPERAAALPLAVGLAVREVAQRHLAPRSRVKVKWPNDVLAAGKKLAGILVESQLAEKRVRALVVGIGLNVHMRELPPELSEIATSLALLGGENLERELLLAELLEALDLRTQRYFDEGIGALLGELRAYDALRDKPVTIDGAPGIARGFADDGALLVEDADGNVRRVLSGTVA